MTDCEKGGMGGRTFFTSDSHFNHLNILKYANRNFRDVNHMNEELVNAWNSVVGPDDTVYHLGDVLMGKLDDGRKYLFRLNGSILLLSGNHDRKSLKQSWFTERFTSIQENMIIEHQGKKIMLNHYYSPVLAAQADYMCFGHSHNQGRSQNSLNSLDVGVDAAFALLGSYRPFSIDEALAFCR